jgi:hypothetical protein
MAQDDERMPEPGSSVETTGLAWGVRSSFRRYVHRVALGSEAPDGGVGSLPDGRFHFPVAEVRELDGGDLRAEITFSGGVRFLGHAGMIDLRIGELQIVLDSGVGILRTSSPEGIRDLAEVRVAHAQIVDGVTTLSMQSRLAAGAEDLFNEVYAAATPFDDIEIRVTQPLP